MLAENGTQLLSPVQLITYQFNLLIRFRFTNEREKTCSLTISIHYTQHLIVVFFFLVWAKNF